MQTRALIVLVILAILFSLGFAYAIGGLGLVIFLLFFSGAIMVLPNILRWALRRPEANGSSSKK